VIGSRSLARAAPIVTAATGTVSTGPLRFGRGLDPDRVVRHFEDPAGADQARDRQTGPVGLLFSLVEGVDLFVTPPVTQTFIGDLPQALVMPSLWGFHPIDLAGLLFPGRLTTHVVSDLMADRLRR
jgi:hypothetical protein